MPDFWAELTKPFPVEDIHWRVGSTSRDKSKALVLAYLDARAIRRRLNEVAGPTGWTVSYEPCARAQGPLAWVCSLTIHPDEGLPVSRSDVADDTDVEPGKGGASDAFKRAFYAFGCDYLYRLGDTWVDLKPQGKHYAGKGQDGRSLYFDTPNLPEWAGGSLPDGAARRGVVAPSPSATQPSPAPSSAPQSASDVQAQAADSVPGEIPQEPFCKVCQGPMWDNRVGKKNPKAPDYKCKDQNCRDPAGDGRFPPAWFKYADFADWARTSLNQAPGPVEQAAADQGVEPAEELPF